MGESLVNAIYRRGYDQPEPVEVRVNPDGMEIVTYLGHDALVAPARAWPQSPPTAPPARVWS